MVLLSRSALQQQHAIARKFDTREMGLEKGLTLNGLGGYIDYMNGDKTHDTNS
jgi:hypothetical protein